MKLTFTLLAHISRRMQNGQPLLALLTANEYLEKDSPLRLALAADARRYVTARKTGALGCLAGKVAEGSKLYELSDSEQKLIRAAESPLQHPPELETEGFRLQLDKRRQARSILRGRKVQRLAFPAAVQR